jgi:hypothetical protein
MSNSNWSEPETLWSNDREYQGKVDRIALERSEYQGRTNVDLRMLWRADDGSFRWSQTREDRNGKHWLVLRIRDNELRALGEALIAASDGRRADRLRDQASKAGINAKVTATTNSAKQRAAAADEDDDRIPF